MPNEQMQGRVQSRFNNKLVEPVMNNILELVNNWRMAGGTMHTLGIAMGYPPTCARQAVSQFVRTIDPRISAVRKFAKAVGIEVVDLFDPELLQKIEAPDAKRDAG